MSRLDLTPEQLAQTTYQSGSGPDQLSISAFDGTTWSAWQNFTVAGPVVKVVEASGSTSLTGVGTNFYLFNGSGSGPALKYAGAAVVAGQFGAWTAIGAEADRNRLSSGLEGRGRRSVHGLEYRQQRQLPLQCGWGRFGKQHGAGIAGDQRSSRT